MTATIKVVLTSIIFSISSWSMVFSMNEGSLKQSKCPQIIISQEELKGAANQQNLTILKKWLIDEDLDLLRQLARNNPQVLKITVLRSGPADKGFRLSGKHLHLLSEYFPHITNLDLTNTYMRNGVLNELGLRFPYLQELSINDNQGVTRLDDLMKHLPKDLVSLDISNTRVDGSITASLQKMRPALSIIQNTQINKDCPTRKRKYHLDPSTQSTKQSTKKENTVPPAAYVEKPLQVAPPQMTTDSVTDKNVNLELENFFEEYNTVRIRSTYGMTEKEIQNTQLIRNKLIEQRFPRLRNILRNYYTVLRTLNFLGSSDESIAHRAIKRENPLVLEILISIDPTILLSRNDPAYYSPLELLLVRDMPHAISMMLSMRLKLLESLLKGLLKAVEGSNNSFLEAVITKKAVQLALQNHDDNVLKALVNPLRVMAGTDRDFQRAVIRLLADGNLTVESIRNEIITYIARYAGMAIPEETRQEINQELERLEQEQPLDFANDRGFTTIRPSRSESSCDPLVLNLTQEAERANRRLVANAPALASFSS